MGPARWGARLHETVVDTAIREADEEAGIGHHDLVVRLTVVTAESVSGWTYTTVIADVTEPVGTVANGESTELRWVPADEVDRCPCTRVRAQLAGVARALGHLGLTPPQCGTRLAPAMSALRFASSPSAPVPTPTTAGRRCRTAGW